MASMLQGAKLLQPIPAYDSRLYNSVALRFEQLITRQYAAVNQSWFSTGCAEQPQPQSDP